MSALTPLEHGIVGRVVETGGRATPDLLARFAARLDSTPDEVRATTESLIARGLISRAPGSGPDVLAITAPGLTALVESAGNAPPGPLDTNSLCALTLGLHGNASTSAVTLMPLMSDQARMRAALLQVVAFDPVHAKVVAAASMFLRPEYLPGFAQAMLDHALPEVRAALFQRWTPPSREVAGKTLTTLLTPDLDPYVRRGLLDPAREVRAAAAMFTFTSERGARMQGELIANIDAPERELRQWTLLALGSATDPDSLDMLEQIASEPDPTFAAAAVRALAARPDGHDAFLAALHEPRPEVRTAALFALGEVARALPPETLARLALEADPGVKAGLARYRLRSGAVSR